MDKVKDSNNGKGNCQETFYLKFFQKIWLMTRIGMVRFGFDIKNVCHTPIFDLGERMIRNMLSIVHSLCMYKYTDMILTLC
jgi:hypothetical protein